MMVASYSASISSSTASLLSYPSTECTTSGSSSSTVPGPGAITGKALKALGKATLRGFDRFLIAKHLSTITHVFPHSDEDASSIRHIDDIYDDLLEFSRQGMYSRGIFEKALGFILEQIGMGQIRFLIPALTRWHNIELHILLSEILIQLAPLWNPSLRLVFWSPLCHLYTAAQPRRQVSPVPLILFFSRLIRTDHRICQVVLDVGFLDVLVALCHNYDLNDHNLRMPKGVSEQPQIHRRLLAACNAALLDIAAYQEHRSLLSKHPIRTSWPQTPDPSIYPEILPFTVRLEALLLDSGEDVVFSDYSPYLKLSIDDICDQPCVSDVPPDQLLLSLTFGVAYDQAIRVCLAGSTHHEKVALLSQLIKTMMSPTSPTLTLPDGPLSALSTYKVLFYLHFIKIVARKIAGGREALIDADVVGYLVHILHTELSDSYFSVITSLDYPLNLPRIISEYGLPSLLNSRGDPGSTRIRSALHGAFAAIYPQKSGSSG